MTLQLLQATGLQVTLILTRPFPDHTHPYQIQEDETKHSRELDGASVDILAKRASKHLSTPSVHRETDLAGHVFFGTERRARGATERYC